jgi:rod shape-determining protein MreD
MLTRRISIAAPIFLLIYVIQEAVVSQFRLPGGGFSVLLIFALTWAVLSETEVAAVIGFAAGFLMDLSQTAAGPFGQWTLIMLLAGYAISYIGFGDDNVQANAIGIIFFVVIANLLVEIAYVTSGALLGVSSGSFVQILITLFGMSIWALLISPILLPVFTRLHALVFDSRSAL